MGFEIENIRNKHGVIDSPIRKQIKRNINVFGAVVVSIILSSCSTTGYQTARHNGKLYYIPEKCKTYSYKYNSDTVYCRDKGVLTGQTLEPVSEQQAQAYRDQQRQSQKPTYTNCYSNYAGGMYCTSY